MLASCPWPAPSQLQTPTTSAPVVETSQPISFRSADTSTMVLGEFTIPAITGPLPVVVLLQSTVCDPFPHCAPSELESWGYAVLEVDSYASRKLPHGACLNFDSLTPAQSLGDAYGALTWLRSNPRIDSTRIAMLGIAEGSTAALVADSEEAAHTYAPAPKDRFRAFFAIAPFCKIHFQNGLRPYAPMHIYIGARDDLTPAAACEEMASAIAAASPSADFKVTVYEHAEHGFDYVPPDLNAPPQNAQMHPLGTAFTYPLRPYFSPIGDNLSRCAIEAKSIFDAPDRSSVKDCIRPGMHLMGEPTAAGEMRDALRTDLARLMPSVASAAEASRAEP